MICDHFVIEHTDSGEFETDEMGNAVYFSYYEDAAEYIKEHELEDVEIVAQY